MGKKKAKKTASKKAPTKKPPAGTEKKIDPRLVGRTLGMIAAHQGADEKSRRKIGEHILEEYFEGKEDLALSTSPVKDKSFAALATQADARYGWGADDLRYAVKIAIAYRSLASDVRLGIPANALARLASIEDEDERADLAERISSGELTGLAAREAIADAGEGEARGGRKRLPIALREGRRVVRAVLRVEETSFSARRVKELDEEQREDLGREIDDAIATLRAIKASLREE